MHLTELPTTSNSFATPAFNSGCKYHARRCKCHLDAAGNLRKTVSANASGSVISAGLRSERKRLAASQAQHFSLKSNLFVQNHAFPNVKTSNDRKAMHYYYNAAGLDLSGYLPGRFWDRIIPRNCQHEPVIQKAVVAVGNAHLEYTSSEPTSATTILSYQKAVTSLRNYMEYQKNPSRQIVLLCCVLFYVFEKLCNDLQAAMGQMQSGLTILNTIQAKAKDRLSSPSRPGSMDADFQHIELVLIQIDIEAAMQDLDQGLRLRDVHVEKVNPPGSTPFKRFWTPHESMEQWMRTCHHVWRFISDNKIYRKAPIDTVPQHVLETKSWIEGLIKDWRQATKHYTCKDAGPIITEYLAAPYDEASNRRILDQINSLIIESHYYVIKCFMAESLLDQDPKYSWDRQASKLLRTGENTLALRTVHRKARDIHVQKTFSPHVGIVECMLSLAHRTKIPRIRSHAQHLIRSLSEAQGGLSGLTPFFAGHGAPPADLLLIYELPGH